MPLASLLRVSGSHRVNQRHDRAHSFAQPRTRRISQLIGLTRPTGSSTSPLRATTSLSDAAMFFLPFRELRTFARAHSPHGSDRAPSGNGHALQQLLVPVEDEVNLGGDRLKGP